MTNSQRLANVRSALREWISASESAAGHTPEVKIGGESILIRGGFYCGRRFDVGTHHAVWFVEEDELKIYDHAGHLVTTMASEEIRRWAGNSQFSGLINRAA